MDTTATRTPSESPIMHYWGLVKDLDSSEKLELVEMLIESLKPVVAMPKKEAGLKPYTIEELHKMIATSERQLANGEWQDFDEAMDEIEKELEIAEAV